MSSCLYRPDTARGDTNGAKKQGGEGEIEKKRRKGYLEVSAKLAKEERMMGGPGRGLRREEAMSQRRKSRKDKSPCTP